MSGKRRKALKRAFIASWGRPPYGAKFEGGVQTHRDEMRPIKKAYVRGVRP